MAEYPNLPDPDPRDALSTRLIAVSRSVLELIALPNPRRELAGAAQQLEDELLRRSGPQTVKTTGGVL